jgi:hypothetical protein
MKAKVKAKKHATKTVEEKDIPQLSGSTIINKRITKCVTELGEFKPEEICTKCKFCKWFMIAKTPLNSKYRQMDAWEKFVEKNVPCEYLNGIENEDGELEVLKGVQDASECENFQLAWERVPEKLKEIIAKARNEKDTIAGDESVLKAKKELEEQISQVDLQIEQLKLQMTELKTKKEDLQTEIEECFITRFGDVDDLINLNAKPFGEIAGRELLKEELKREEAAEKLKALGFEPNQKKVQFLTVSVADIERIQAKSADNTYGGFFTKTNDKGLRVDILGNTLASYAGQTFEFQTELVEVAKSKGFRKQVIFQETDENFVQRKGISILELLCGDKKMRWREDVVVAPTVENLNEIEDADDDENGEGEE